MEARQHIVTTKETEELLEDLRQEAQREIEQAEGSYGTAHAWFYSHVGALDMCRQLGLISEERRDDLADAWFEANPAINAGADVWRRWWYDKNA